MNPGMALVILDLQSEFRLQSPEINRISYSDRLCEYS
jgi:hypothetical protein